MSSQLSQFPLLNVIKMKILKRKSLAEQPSSSVEAISTYPETEPRRFSVSQAYYTDASYPEAFPPSRDQPYSKQYSTKQSQHLPIWLVALISHSLGVHPNRSPLFGTILHVITFTVALIYIISFFWFRTYDVMSPNTPLDILQGSMTILIALIWTALGMYAKSLAKRLFLHPRLIKDIRMHSRTIFKINAAFLAFLLGLVFIVTNDINSTGFLDPQTCQLIELPVFVCWMHFLSKVLFSVFSLMWNTLIAIIVISICRTHTIGVRRFIKELEKDAWLYDNLNCMQYREHPMTKEDVFEETIWLEEEQSSGDDEFVLLRSKMMAGNDPNIIGAMGNANKREECTVEGNLLRESPKLQRSTSWREPRLQFQDESIRRATINVIPIHEPFEFESDVPHIEQDSVCDRNDDMHIVQFDSEEEVICPDEGANVSTAREVELETLPGASIECSGNTTQDASKIGHMSSEEILHKYWKMSCRLRASSCVFQRWLASLIALVVIWCIIYLLHWQYAPADISDVIQFVIPLLLLPLLCSAFAEVNLEGVRLVKCIFPNHERLPLLRFLQMNPLQMTIFNVNLSYSTILTVVFAIFVAFTSRLIFTELQKS